MGKYTITIWGAGAHSAGQPTADAEQLAADLVQRLQSAGHDLSVAQFDVQHADGTPAGHTIDLLSFVETGIGEAPDAVPAAPAPTADGAGADPEC